MLVGLKDDYSHDGRALVEDFTGWAVPPAVKKNGIFVPLAQAYKQINASVGQLGMASLQVSTKALASGSASDDSTYTNLENALSLVNTQRDAIAAQMIALLEAAEFNGQPISRSQADGLLNQTKGLLSHMRDLATAR